MKAAREGHREIVRLLIQHSANVQKTMIKAKKEFKAIHEACKQEDPDIVKQILDADQDLLNDQENYLKFTPLFIAGYNGNLEVCQLLIDRNADLNKMTGKQRTVLDACIKNDEKEVAILLKKHNACY